jgi:hypothetical protein
VKIGLGWHRCAPESEKGEELRRGVDHTVEKASPAAEKGMSHQQRRRQPRESKVSCGIFVQLETAPEVDRNYPPLPSISYVLLHLFLFSTKTTSPVHPPLDRT